MEDEGDALLVVGDAQAVSAVALDAEGCLASIPRRYTVSMCARSRIFFVPLPSKRAWTIFPMREACPPCGTPLARIHELDLAAQRAHPPGDQLGGAIQALEVAAAGLDRDELLQACRGAAGAPSSRARAPAPPAARRPAPPQFRTARSREPRQCKLQDGELGGSRFSSCSCGAIASRAVYRYALTCISPRTMWRGA